MKITNKYLQIKNQKKGERFIGTTKQREEAGKG